MEVVMVIFVTCAQEFSMDGTYMRSFGVGVLEDSVFGLAASDTLVAVGKAGGQVRTVITILSQFRWAPNS